MLPADESAESPSPMHSEYAPSEWRAWGRQALRTESATRAESATGRRGVVGADASVSRAIRGEARCWCCAIATAVENSVPTTATITVLTSSDRIVVIDPVLPKGAFVSTHSPPNAKVQRPAYNVTVRWLSPIPAQRRFHFRDGIPAVPGGKA